MNVLVEKVRAINPKLVDEIEKKAKSDGAKISMLRSYLVHALQAPQWCGCSGVGRTKISQLEKA